MSVFICALLLLGNLVFVGQAFAEYQITLFGTVLAPGEKGGVNAYVLWTQNQKWHLNFTKASVIDNLGSTPDAWVVLQQVSPNQINIVGKKELIQSFAAAAIPGKKLQISGVLYVDDGVMLMSSFEEVK